MSLSGKGMLINYMSISEENEADFNNWYDREHLAERVEIPGFSYAARYKARDTNRKYLSLYLTDEPCVLSSDAYLKQLANRSEWSQRVRPLFKSPVRGLASITLSKGHGRGSNIAFIRLAPEGREPEAFRASIENAVEPVLQWDGVLSAHLLECGAVDKAPAGASADSFLVVEATGPQQADRARDILSNEYRACLVEANSYGMLWSLTKEDLAA